MDKAIEAGLALLTSLQDRMGASFDDEAELHSDELLVLRAALEAAQSTERDAREKAIEECAKVAATIGAGANPWGAAIVNALRALTKEPAP